MAKTAAAASVVAVETLRGAPQCGHLVARNDTIPPQSAQFVVLRICVLDFGVLGLCSDGSVFGSLTMKAFPHFSHSTVWFS
ncbi:hypothetical protein SDC9_154850 [bioreactor metagenome]|uniref:Uncharacterized protein n=1 Tax=bioreactor metagenome TaxID=1076179 RepID=A0A645F2B8_9ZZZZ